MRARKEGTEAASRSEPRAGWAPTTRRRFLGLVMAAGAASVVAPKAVKAVSGAGDGEMRKPRWIGHC